MLYANGQPRKRIPSNQISLFVRRFQGKSLVGDIRLHIVNEFRSAALSYGFDIDTFEAVLLLLCRDIKIPSSFISQTCRGFLLILSAIIRGYADPC